MEIILVKIAIETQILFVHNKTTVKVALLLAIFSMYEEIYTV